MLQIALKAKKNRIAFVGRGGIALKRLKKLQHSGGERFQVFLDGEIELLPEAEDMVIVNRLPYEEELYYLSGLFVAGLSPAESKRLYHLAKAKGVLVNVAEWPDLSDFDLVSDVSSDVGREVA